MTSFPFHSRFSAEIHGKCVRIPAGLQTKEALFCFLQREIPLPDYFGGNWDALEECFGDLNWVPGGKLGLVHEDVPMYASVSDQKIYLGILSECVRSNDPFLAVFPEKEWEKIKILLSPSFESS